MADHIQLDLFSQSKTPEETKWKTITVRVDPDEKLEILTTCRWINLPISVILRIIFRILARRRQEMPQVKDSPVKMIDQAVDEFLTYLPQYVRQRQVAPRSF